jgi:hypothetical protein
LGRKTCLLSSYFEPLIDVFLGSQPVCPNAGEDEIDSPKKQMALYRPRMRCAQGCDSNVDVLLLHGSFDNVVWVGHIHECRSTCVVLPIAMDAVCVASASYEGFLQNPRCGVIS